MSGLEAKTKNKCMAINTKTPRLSLVDFEAQQEEYRRAMFARKVADNPLPASQFTIPRIHIYPPDDGEIEVVLVYGLPCCGIDIKLECPSSFTLEQLRQFISKTSELREWTKNELFRECPLQKEAPTRMSGLGRLGDSESNRERRGHNARISDGEPTAT